MLQTKILFKKKKNLWTEPNTEPKQLTCACRNHKRFRNYSLVLCVDRYCTVQISKCISAHACTCLFIWTLLAVNTFLSAISLIHCNAFSTLFAASVKRLYGGAWIRLLRRCCWCVTRRAYEVKHGVWQWIRANMNVYHSSIDTRF